MSPPLKNAMFFSFFIKGHPMLPCRQRVVPKHAAFPQGPAVPIFLPQATTLPASFLQWAPTSASLVQLQNPQCSQRGCAHGAQKIWLVPPIYKVLAWKSRWRSLLDRTQYDIMTSLSRHSWFVLSCIVANELAAQHSNTWLVFALAVAAHFRNPPPSQASPV